MKAQPGELLALTLTRFASQLNTKLETAIARQLGVQLNREDANEIAKALAKAADSLRKVGA